MNAENFKELISKLRKTKLVVDDYQATAQGKAGIPSFSMKHYFFTCDTPACIAGWAAHLNGTTRRIETPESARAYLDITREVSDILFMPVIPVEYKDITPEMAITALENVLKWDGYGKRELSTYDVWGFAYPTDEEIF